MTVKPENEKELTSIIIPKSVTSIEDEAYFGFTTLISISIPDSVTSIGEYAFYECSNLSSISIPNSVTSIGQNAFCGCTSLTSITIPDSVKSIGSGTFFGCSSLTTITIPKSITSLGGSVFKDCVSLTSIALPDSLTSIGENVFNGCYSLLSITIPEGVKSIKYKAFYGCSSIASITIPKSVKSIWKDVFKNCVSLISIIIPESVTSIGDGAFFGCTFLASIAIPDSVTSIGDGAFFGCTSLASIAIPDSVARIEPYSFNHCSSLTSVTIPDSVTSIERYAFSHCSCLTSITIADSVTSIESYAFYDCSSLTSFIIPDSVTSIGEGAFSGCFSLTSIIIPDSVANIGEGVFRGCDKLRFYYAPDVLAATNIESEKMGKRIIGYDYGMISNHISVYLPSAMKEYSTSINALIQDNNGGFNFEAYDALFDNLKTRDKSLMAFYRLKQPVNLNEENRKKYESSIRRHFYFLINYIIENNDIEAGIQSLVEFKVITYENFESMLMNISYPPIKFGDGVLNTICRCLIRCKNGNLFSHSDFGIASDLSNPAKLEIGDEYQGGKIFYILLEGDAGYDAKVIHGLIAATEDQGSGIIWSQPENQDESVLETLTTIGSGSANTDRIIAQNRKASSCAARLAHEYQGGGYTDWYLPSLEELNELFAVNRMGWHFSEENYWSSSEHDDTSYCAWNQNFINGIQDYTDKYMSYSVRSIRSF
ncbi:MAG: leucine-rich repeat protein [Erysipelotrichaceae bacterium]